MTLGEIFRVIEQYEKEVIGKQLGDAGHTIHGFGIDVISPGNYEVYVLGENLSSGVSIVKKPLNDWLKDNNLL